VRKVFAGGARGNPPRASTSNGELLGQTRNLIPGSAESYEIREQEDRGVGDLEAGPPPGVRNASGMRGGGLPAVREVRQDPDR
jgi:hypothetical protein